METVSLFSIVTNEFIVCIQSTQIVITSFGVSLIDMNAIFL